jgi:hypothetical protein
VERRLALCQVIVTDVLPAAITEHKSILHIEEAAVHDVSPVSEVITGPLRRVDRTAVSQTLPLGGSCVTEMFGTIAGANSQRHTNDPSDASLPAGLEW